MTENDVRVEWQALQDFTAKVFEGLGMPAQRFGRTLPDGIPHRNRSNGDGRDIA